MILTITANPTIDRILFVRDFAMQDLVRADREVLSPSGKGLDVSLILHDWGAATQAIALKAGRNGDYLADLVTERGLAVDWIGAQGETRMAALITDVTRQRQSTILAHTLRGSDGTLAHIEQTLAKLGPQSWGLVCAGSLPPGLPVDSYARLLRQAHALGLVTLLDTSGPALQQGVSACPHILKLNRAELAQLAPGLFPTTGKLSPDHLTTAAAGLAPHIGKWAQAAFLVTLGRHGLLMVAAQNGAAQASQATDAFYVPALPMPVVSPAGAGDAVSAGLMWARRRGLDWRSSLAYGAAAGAVAVTQAATADCPRPAVERLLDWIEVEQFPLSASDR